MKKYIKYSCMAFLLVCMASNGFAQKYGHLNSGNLLALLPATKNANSELTAYQEQLLKAHDVKVKDFRERGGKFMQEYQSGKMSAVDAQQQQAALQKEQEDLLKNEQEIVQKVQARREKLLKPILERVDKAIHAVGKERGYTMIFDTSSFNAVLFAKDSDDVMPLVKAKLGI